MCNRKIYCWILLLFFSSSLIAQDYELYSIEHEIKNRTDWLDKSLQKQDSNALNILLSDKVSFGHSNGWVQNKNDVFEDFRNGILSYQSIDLISIENITYAYNGIRVRRTIKVKGKYKEYDFDMKLSVLEIWINNDSGKWQLWARQSVKVE